MRICKSLLLVSVIITVSLLAGCEPYVYQRPVINDSLTRTTYEPIDISKITPPPNDRYQPTESYVSRGNLSGRTILIDPGHGGKDPGAGSIGYSDVPEKDLNLDIAEELATRLRAKGASVIMSRNDDYFIELDDRAYMADSHHVDLLVSIHCDSHSNRFISGSSIYTANECSWKSGKVAKNIRDSFGNSSIRCRGTRNADFRVLAKHSRPAVLVECGYMTNRYDADALNNSWYRKKIAAAIADGIANSF